MTGIDPHTLIVRAADAQRDAAPYQHPLNPRSRVQLTHLSSRVGLQRVGVSLVTVPAGKESFAYHMHYADEEWVYILSGRAIAEINDEELEVGAGDFLGFPAPGVAHHLRNSFSEDLVYLMGGEAHPVEVADFPRQGKRMVRRGNRAELHDIDAAQPFWSDDDEGDSDEGDGDDGQD